MRVQLETEALVTEIGEATGLQPQHVADAAIAHCSAHLRRTGKSPKASEESPQKRPEAS
ncbi:hypothetical protein ACIHCV_22335 [Streptomyces sp. NPDC051956]|uniref:hypothetical protein n=1 Tax=Streptomyces sp. NPDC051956 TaxID=3365677 RepID=UPI0037D848FC